MTWGLQWHGIIQHKLPDVRKMFWQFCLCDDQQDPCWLLSTLKGQEWEPMVEGGPKTCPVLIIPPGKQQRWPCRGIWSDSAVPRGLGQFYFPLNWHCCGMFHCGAKGTPCPALLLVFQGIPQRGNHRGGSQGAQGGESTPQSRRGACSPSCPSAGRRVCEDRSPQQAAAGGTEPAWSQHPRKTRGWMWRWLSSQEQAAQLELKSCWAWSSLIMAFTGLFPWCENPAQELLWPVFATGNPSPQPHFLGFAGSSFHSSSPEHCCDLQPSLFIWKMSWLKAIPSLALTSTGTSVPVPSSKGWACSLPSHGSGPHGSCNNNLRLRVPLQTSQNYLTVRRVTQKTPPTQTQHDRKCNSKWFFASAAELFWALGVDSSNLDKPFKDYQPLK